jgi:hypothetical protein
MRDLIGREHLTHVHGPLCPCRATVMVVVVVIAVVVMVVVVVVV